ncbi:putative aldehyde oxidase Art an 7 [Andrographis paniculata]|uniref:putative aldehyde oxidase Art an 7 n=1 Tax=Andrographis paniculata TaxID=175694 RepID=UPI0021E979D3|nr:putative aldehyde oxidase Art an 7 [Andrographis paniculata]
MAVPILRFIAVLLHCSLLCYAGGRLPIGGEAAIDDYIVEPTNFLGSWRVDSPNCGVSAMHMQLLPNNKLIMYDSTSNGLSEIKNDPPLCRGRVGGRPTDPQLDCTAHALEYDAETAQMRPLNLASSPWCSSGGMTKNGELMSTGGDKDGFRAVRILKPCPNCQFEEKNLALFSNRWYATDHPLENGTFAIVGGRDAYNYELVPVDTLEFTPQIKALPLLAETDDDAGRENNLYPFVNLLPDGNLFVFANYKSIVLNPYTGEAVRKFPDLAGSRNYPPSAMSALLPVDLSSGDPKYEVIICGGNSRDAYIYSDLQQPNRTFLPALKDCQRIDLMKEGADWDSEDMPSPRVMGDMVILPTGDLLILNGAKAGTSAWNAADQPNMTPVLYTPNKPKGLRFKELAPTTVPRMYHSNAAVLPSAEILIAGSNTNAFYMMPKYNDLFIFPTEMRTEKFTPPYLDPLLQDWRVEITGAADPIPMKYGGTFTLTVTTKKGPLLPPEVKVTMYSPPFTTHGYCQNQRLLILSRKVSGNTLSVEAPPSGKVAPPGYYLIFVVRRGIPSRGVWARIDN